MKHLILDSFHVTYVWEHLCADVCFEKYERRRNQTSKRDERSSVESWLWQSLIAGKEVLLLLWKQVYTDTLPEVQRRRMLSRVIPPLAEFPVILPSKRKHRCVSNRIKLWSHRCFFSKGHNWSRCQQKLLIQRLVSQCLFSPRSCLPISLWIHPSLAWAPWGVLISNHYLMTEICRQKTRRHTVP